MTADTLLRALRDAVGSEHVLVDPGVTASYEVDWTGRFRGRSLAVTRPGSPAEVAAVVTACASAGVGVVPQGGNTGLVGGGVPVDGEVVVSTRRLATIDAVDEVAGQITVGAGASLAAVQRVARAVGFDVAVDLAARDSATIGGLVATNAGGERVLRYGPTRAHVAGVEAVLADGTVVSRLAGLPKDNTGYDVGHLLIGSEGTLGILTRIRLRLVPLLARRAVALVAVPDTAAAVEVVRRARHRLPSLEAAELLFAAGLDLVRAHTGLPAPFAADAPAYVLLECAAAADPEDDLLAALDDAGDAAGVLDATVATDPRGRHALWAYRESHTEAINAAGVPVKLDVAVPLPSLAAVVAALPDAVASVAPGARLVVFGHVNEGNLHVNVLDAVDAADDVTTAVLELVAARGGSISAEHGIGRAKRRWLGLSRSPEEIAVMRRIKAALDPDGILNPGVLLD